jgi:RNA polymerase sigma-70 factor (ECF subfamily)
VATSRSRAANSQGDAPDTLPRSIDADGGRSVVRTADAFEETVRPHVGRLYRYCLALTADRDRADDLLQATLVKAHAHWSEYLGAGQLVAWLCGIARHEHLETRRTESRRRGLIERASAAWSAAFGAVPGHAESAGERDPEALTSDRERGDLLLACLRELPEEFRAAVVLCDVEELGLDEAAALIGVPVGTVKSRLSRARARLREAYERRTAGRASRGEGER